WETVARGFGVHAAFDGHDLHGLIAGPDGKIYFSVGDNGFSVTTREGRRLHHPNTGGVLRMEPDGSQLEVFATGLRNPQEIAFDEDGNFFAVDNDGDLRDERERFVHVAEGGDSGWRLHWQFRDPGWAEVTGQPDYNPWTDERMWVPWHPGQPAHLTPPLTNYSVGPGSLRFNPGTALGERHRGHFFVIQFPVQKVTAFRAVPRGAGFALDGEHLVLSGMMASCLDFRPDGALAVGDWDGLWDPNQTGAIWLLDDPAGAGSPVRREVQRWLAEGLRSRSLAELPPLLGHPDQRIRLRAQYELTRRGAGRELLRVVDDRKAPVLARIHALWGLIRLPGVLRAGSLPFSDPEPRVRAQAARVAGDRKLDGARRPLVRLLGDPEPRVRFHAALALGKLGREDTSVEPLVRLLAENHADDPFLRHAAVMGLAGAAQPATLAAQATNASVRVRTGAVVALRRQRAPEVARFLGDADGSVRREAARAIHDDESIPAALPALAALAEGSGWESDPALARRVLNGNLRLGGPAHASRLAALARRDRSPETIRIEAVEALGAWDRRPALDRVEGLVRPPGPRPAGLGDRLLAENAPALLPTAPSRLAAALTRQVIDRRLEIEPAFFARWVASTSQPPALRVQALEYLARRQAPELPVALQAALAASPPELRLAALRLEATRQPQALFEHARAQEDRLTLAEQQAVLALAGSSPVRGAVEWLGAHLDRLAAGTLPPTLALDVLEAARRHPDPALQRRALEQDRQLAAGGVARQREPLLQGGDPRAGEAIFRNPLKGQCVRCHDAGGEGQQAGPVLRGLGQRVAPAYLVEALLDPGARIADGFALLTLTLKDGETLDGLRLRESTESITLRLTSGETRVVPRASVTRQSASQVSTMPPMGGVLTPREIRDVVAFLSTWR
ncbi:MAG: HEAT repeat domain-containing protein, partial [Verrucomicrobiota bacterium]